MRDATVPRRAAAGRSGRRQRLRVAMVLACAVVSSSPDVARGQSPQPEPVEAPATPAVSVRATTGFEYDRGDYGLSDDTELWSVPFALRLGWRGWTLSVATSWIQVEGPSLLLGLGASGAGRTGTDSGQGDTLVGLAWAWEPANLRLPVVELGVKVKIPTADEDELLGTGETDVTLQVDLARRFGPITGFAGAGYRFVGSPLRVEVPGRPRALEQRLDDIWLASIGASAELHERIDLGLLYEFRQSTVGGVDDAHELVVFSALELHRRLSVGPYAVVGFSDNSPAYGLGLQVTVRR